MSTSTRRSAVTASVVICAYTMGRWDDLTAAVKSAYSGSVRPNQIVLAIDYNDELLARVRQHVSAHIPVPVTVVANSHRKGLSGNRNSAIEASDHEVVVFLDDDAVATPRWLETTLAHYAHDHVLGVGGAAAPVWPERQSTRPATLPAAPGEYGDLDWVVGCSYHGQPTSTANVRNLMGCNMSFRRSIFTRTQGFSEALGRIGKTPLGCEETELCIRVHQLEPTRSILFEPAAMVWHHVSPDRTTWKYLVRRCFGEGVSKAAVAAMVDPGLALQSERSYVIHVLGKAFLRELRQVPRGRFRGFLGAAAIGIGLAATTAGYVRGLMGRRRRPKDVADVPLLVS